MLRLIGHSFTGLPGHVTATGKRKLAGQLVVYRARNCTLPCVAGLVLPFRVPGRRLLAGLPGPKQAYRASGLSAGTRALDLNRGEAGQPGTCDYDALPGLRSSPGA